MPSFRGITLSADTISWREGLRRHSHPVAGAEAWVETSGQVDRRLSLTRTAGGALLAGPIGAVLGGIAKKKLDDRQLWLIVHGPGYATSVEVPIDKVGMDGSRKGYARRQERRARRFAAKVTAAGGRALAQQPRVEPYPTVPPPGSG